MAAFAVVIFIFSFWSLVGFALLATLNKQSYLLQNALLSPATGVAASVVLVVWLNCLGLPVRYGGPTATAALIALSFLLLRRARPAVSLRSLLPFAGVLFLAAIATGYPFLKYGFNWISYGNDDMTNYCLGAKFFLNNGQYAQPPVKDVIMDRDASLLYWSFYIVGAVRHGVDELLAWVASCTGLTTSQAFMPLILALHLVLIASAGSLVAQNARYRTAALVSSLVLALSALTTLGTTYQLLGQVGGLGMLAANCTILLRPATNRRPAEWLLAGLLAAGMGMIYPEVTPFLAAAFVIYHISLMCSGKESISTVALGLLLALISSAVFLNISAVTTGITLLSQSSVGTAGTPKSLVLFPYYLTPAGFAYLWGFQAVNQQPSGFVLDLSILGGLVLFLLAIAATVWISLQRHPIAFMCLVMISVALYLFHKGSDFGLYKIAMYIQPFLIGCLIIGWTRVYYEPDGNGWRRLWLLPLLVVVIWGFQGQLAYSTASLGRVGGGLVELPDASSSGLLSKLSDIGRESTRPILSDTPNVVLAKFESAYHGPIYFVTKDFFGSIFGRAPKIFAKWNLFDRVFGAAVLEAVDQRSAQFRRNAFDTHGALPMPDWFSVRSGTGKLTELLISSPKLSIVNRRRGAADGRDLVQLVQTTAMRNYLLFVASTFGNSYYLAGMDRPAGRVSMYQPERDYFFPGETMMSLGRFALFRVLSPSAPIRMTLEYTASLNSDKDNRIPAASVIGDSWRSFAVQGRGSARLFSPPMELQRIDGNQYIALDMGGWGWSFPEHRSKLMSLYGRDVPLDGRRIVGFARDISVISDEEYNALVAPERLERFPANLANRALEYSGIYEDGWVAESSYAVLNEFEGRHFLRISLMVPAVSGRPTASSVSVDIDGREVGRKALMSGPVSIRYPVDGLGKHRVALRFDRAVGLPDPDNRPVSAQLQFLGFIPDTAN
jgi:hypothetical protein